MWVILGGNAQSSPPAERVRTPWAEGACRLSLLEYRIILHDNTLNLPGVARQPHPDPNYASFTAARRVAGASRTSLGVS